MFSNHVITLCNIWLHMHLQENIKCPWWGIYTYVYLVTLIWDLSIYLSVFPRLDRAFARTVRAIVLSSYWTSTLPDTLPDGIASPRHHAIAFPSNEATSIFNCRPHTRQHLAASGNKDQRSCDAMQKFVAEKKMENCCNMLQLQPVMTSRTSRHNKTIKNQCRGLLKRNFTKPPRQDFRSTSTSGNKCTISGNSGKWAWSGALMVTGGHGVRSVPRRSLSGALPQRWRDFFACNLIQFDTNPTLYVGSSNLLCSFLEAIRDQAWQYWQTKCKDKITKG